MNTILTKLNKYDLSDFIDTIDNHLIIYKDLLDIDSSFLFGIEIEYEKYPLVLVDKFIQENHNDYVSRFEVDMDHGGEIISPILNDSIKTWQELRQICIYLKNNKVTIDQNAGGHIHTNASFLGNNVDAWKKFIILYSLYEGIIYRFTYNERINARTYQDVTAYPIARLLYNKRNSILNSKSINGLKRYLSLDLDRYKGLNLNNVMWSQIDSNKNKNTIEFRMPNGTVNHTIWQNNIYFIYRLLNTCKKDIDIERILRESNNDICYTSYNEINYQKAIELADLIYDNDLEKRDFLKQYFKDFKVAYAERPVYSTKKLTL